MKIYKKTYEDVYTSKRKLAYCVLDKITIANDLTLDEYSNRFRKTMRGAMLNFFETVVRYAWLSGSFEYLGKRRSPFKLNYGVLDSSYSVYTNHFLKIDFTFYTRSFGFGKILTYLLELYPYFFEDDPFKNPKNYKYPFKNIGVDFMATVYQMEERMDMLRYADKKKMSYRTYLDFVINQVLCINDELGYKKYIIMKNPKYPLYVRLNKENEKAKTSYIYPRF